MISFPKLLQDRPKILLQGIKCFFNSQKTIGTKWHKISLDSLKLFFESAYGGIRKQTPLALESLFVIRQNNSRSGYMGLEGVS